MFKAVFNFSILAADRIVSVQPISLKDLPPFGHDSSHAARHLGFYENDRSEKVLWDYYHYFKEHFPNETYSDGPLLGFEEMRARKKEKSRTAFSNKDTTVN
jgi:hypothetical protein